MGHAPDLLKRIRRFALVGAAATIVHVLIAFVTIRFLSAPPVLGNVAAFLLAALFSYMGHTLWSFEHRTGSDTFGKFGVVAGVGFICTIVVSGAVDRMGYPYEVGIFAVVTVVPSVTFLLHNFWTYSASSRRPFS